LKSKIYFPNLDGWRFIAALAVLLSHVVGRIPIPENTILKLLAIALSLDGFGGDAGVSFFFVLSGFLITYLMFIEEDETGSFDLLYFYIRRILRIWPLYFLTLFIGFVIYPFFVSNYVETADWRMYALFLANFDNIYFGWPKTGILGVQWSVAVEEQFYIFWPLIFLLFRKSRNFIHVITGGIVLSVFCRIMGLHQYHTLSCIADLFIGALIAYLSKYHYEVVIRFFSNFSRGRTALVYAGGILLLLFNFQLNKQLQYYHSIDRLINSVFFAFIIMEQNFSPHSFFKMKNVPVAGWLGRISYGIYSLHMVAVYLSLFLISFFNLNIWFLIPLTLFITVLMSHVSYNFFERRFLIAKQKFVKV
jgi:peptidoglycan/LPS O-acetylase OafA/YrhL